MTPAPRHIIRTHSLRVGIAQAGPAQDLLALAAEIARTRLAEEADIVFTRHGPASRHVRLARVELNLGTIPEDRFARDFPLRFREALEAEVIRQLRMDDTRSGVAREPASGSNDVNARLALLAHLLQRGLLPWWAAPATGFDPAAEFMALLASAPGQVAALLRRIGRIQAVRFRLVRWLADPELASLIRVLAPADAAFILAYAADLDTRQHEEPFVPAPAAEFRHAKWEIILGHLLADAGSRFNAKAFLRQTIRALAGRFRLRYADLLGELAACAQRDALAWRDSSLPSLLLEIHTEDVLIEAGADASMAPDSRAFLVRWAGFVRQVSPSPPPAGAESLAFWRSLPRREALALARALVERHGAAAVARVLAGLSASDRAALRELLPGIKDPTHPKETALDDLAEALRSPAHPDTNEFAALQALRAAGILTRRSALTLVERHGAAALLRALDRLPAAAHPVLRKLLADTATSADQGAATADEHRESSEASADRGFDEFTTLRTLLETGLLPHHPALTGWRGRPDEWMLFLFARHPGAAIRMLRAWLGAPHFTAAMAHRLPATGLSAIREILAESGDEPALRLLPLAPMASQPQTNADPSAQPGRPPSEPTPLHDGQRLPVANHTEVAELAALSPLLLLRLWQLLITSAPIARLHTLLLGALAKPSADLSAENAFPVLTRLDLTGWWTAMGRHLLGQGAAYSNPWRALLRAQSDAQEGVRAALDAEPGERLLKESLFEGQPAQAQVWHDALAWLKTSPKAADLVPGGRAGLRPRLWAVLADLVRESGGYPVRDAMAFLIRALARLGAGRNAGGTAAEREAVAAHGLREALAADGSRDARQLNACLSASTARCVSTPVAMKTRSHPSRDGDESDATDRLDDGEPHWIENAGLVLLAPFFTRLFARCDLLADGEFAGLEAAQRAVHLLQFLVTGDPSRYREYSLSLNKVLCGYEPESPVVTEVALTAEECTAATDLLEFAAGQWPRGAKVSPDGLRQSYLRRPGRLERGEEAWSLKVETRGWDVLLPELSWIFPGPKPKWMPLPLMVEWI